LIACRRVHVRIDQPGQHPPAAALVELRPTGLHQRAHPGARTGSDNTAAAHHEDLVHAVRAIDGDDLAAGEDGVRRRLLGGNQ
jgi:hypothetical protein